MKKFFYEGVIIVLTTLYGAEAWGNRSDGRRKIKFIEMLCKRGLMEVLRMDKIRNEEVSRIAEKGSWRVEWSREYWDVAVMWREWVSYCVAIATVLIAEVSGMWAPGRTRVLLMVGVKVALYICWRGMTVEAARKCSKDRKEWRALVSECVLRKYPSNRPPELWLHITSRGIGCPYITRLGCLHGIWANGWILVDCELVIWLDMTTPYW